jgi:hypothetical protein
VTFGFVPESVIGRTWLSPIRAWREKPSLRQGLENLKPLGELVPIGDEQIQALRQKFLSNI